MSASDGVQGIDISKWQTTTPSLGAYDFVIARATIGTLRDEMYAKHIAKAKAAGLVTGAYHFNHDAISIASQVSAFLSAAGDVDLFALDVEGRNAFSKAQASEFIDRVQQTGRRCGLYMSESQFFNAGQDWHWVANWSQPPTRSWHIWQWQGSPLDKDRFNGSLTQLHAFAAKEATVGFVAGDGINFGVERWTLDGQHEVVSIGAPRLANGTSDPALRFVLVNGSDDVNLVDRYKRLSNPRPVADSAAFLAALQVAAMPVLTPEPDETPFSQADIDAAVAATEAEAAETIASAVADAVENERERIALAEAQRIRGIA